MPKASQKCSICFVVKKANDYLPNTFYRYSIYLHFPCILSVSPDTALPIKGFMLDESEQLEIIYLECPQQYWRLIIIMIVIMIPKYLESF